MNGQSKETGVEEFARILEIPHEKAQYAYDLIKKHQSIIMQEAHLASELVNFTQQWNSQETLTQLEYIEKHFIGQLSDTIRKRISVLKGEPDEYTAYLKLLSELQVQEKKFKDLQSENNRIREQYKKLEVQNEFLKKTLKKIASRKIHGPLESPGEEYLFELYQELVHLAQNALLKQNITDTNQIGDM